MEGMKGIKIQKNNKFKKEEEPMKTKIVIMFCICFSVATFMTIDLSGLTMHIEGFNAAYALDAQTGYQPGPGQPQPSSVPEPSTLLLLGIGAAGVGIYSFVRRRDRNKRDK
jgi:hypothetical protein